MFDLLKSTEEKQNNKAYEYVAFKQKLESEDLGLYETYGIKLKGGDTLVNDVACDYEETNKIADKLNKYQADPLHILDIIQDMIAR